MSTRHYFGLVILLAMVGGYALRVSVAATDTGSSSEVVMLGSDELVAGIPGEGPLKLAEIERWLEDPRNHKALTPLLPPGLAAGVTEIQGLDTNPLTRAKIELGRQLYFDGRLSSDTSISCATCHDPSHGYADDTPVSFGVGNQAGGRNSPTAMNRILSGEQFWDGRAATLEDQAVGPIANPVEMSNTHDSCVESIGGIDGYRVQFARIFPDGLTIDNVAKAIASFERTIVSGTTPWDHYERLASFKKTYADDLEYLDELEEEDPEFVADYNKLVAASQANPVSEAAIRGGALFFGKANCSVCHNGANYTDEQYHNLGVGMDAAEPDLGRYVVTDDDADRGAFKTPSLRNIAETAPYMHDGSQETLEEVVEWYDQGGHANEWLSESITPLDLTDEEKSDLVEFMKSLTGKLPKVEQGRLPE
ncbi:cytochrome-c peroxidase [Aeoliella sp. SH292]|uniref:cytochrome-c peroxidase n=1 Tax=Aeoliella sp. SH292 TaxID=3454464 RepID=UPI003F949A89